MACSVSYEDADEELWDLLTCHRSAPGLQSRLYNAFTRTEKPTDFCTQASQESDGPFPWVSPASTSNGCGCRQEQYSPVRAGNKVPRNTVASTLFRRTQSSWKDADLPEEMLILPTIMDVLKRVDAHDKVCWRLPARARTAGGVLRHAIKTIDSLQTRLSPMLFKIGMTHDAVRRWECPEYGYMHEMDRWEGMIILFLCPEKFSPAMLEAALIEKYSSSLADIEKHTPSIPLTYLWLSFYTCDHYYDIFDLMSTVGFQPAKVCLDVATFGSAETT